MIILALECYFTCCEACTRVVIHLYHYMHWAIMGVPCSVYMNMKVSSWVFVYFHHYMLQSNHDDMLTTTLITISTLKCLMQGNITMKKATTHSFLWKSFNLYPLAPPSEFPSGSGYISPYIPPLVTIQTQYSAVRFTKLLYSSVQWTTLQLWLRWGSLESWPQSGRLIHKGSGTGTVIQELHTTATVCKKLFGTQANT